MLALLGTHTHTHKTKAVISGITKPHSVHSVNYDLISFPHYSMKVIFSLSWCVFALFCCVPMIQHGVFKACRKRKMVARAWIYCEFLSVRTIKIIHHAQTHISYETDWWTTNNIIWRGHKPFPYAIWNKLKDWEDYFFVSVQKLAPIMHNISTSNRWINTCWWV